MAGKSPKVQKYSPALRSFALTLNYYSPRAYEYVRKTFNTCLPHPRTLKKWYSKVGGDPGFTNESFTALKRKADSVNYEILATLVIDEMNIRRRIEWDGSKLHGYVDMGTGLDGDHLAEAKEALVFLVTAINQNFKVPVAYFLVDGVTGLQRAELVKKCLEMCHEAGVKVVALTFDGCAANISMAGHLGCSFLTNNMKFEHPVTKHPIVAILDPCHMLKLLRNSFENYKTLIDQDGNKVLWQYLVDLNNLQKKETFHLANKLKDRHINFKNERMKVKLASQLFSTSVADAIMFCRKDLKIDLFQNSEPTEFFLRLVNNIFDIFNSRNLHFHGFKKALNMNNAVQIFDYLDKAAEYIKHLKIENGTCLINSPRKVGYLGFLGCIESIKYLYKSLIETKTLIYLPFYKLNQDHLELFFCNIRAHGGSNNNPTARQFVSAYKKMLVHVEIKDSDRGNCTALEEISILNCSSAVERINLSTMRYDVSQENAEEEDEEFDEMNYMHFSDFSKQSIAYIAGFIVKQLIKKIKCDICVSALVAEQNQSLHKFIIAKSKGGLLYPSGDVIKVCETSELFLKDCKCIKKCIVINKIMRQFIGTSLFQDINYHQLGEFPASNHITDLMKAIISKYINIRMHHLLKLKIQQSKRQLLNKYVLFKGQ